MILSIIICTRDREILLDKCLDSLTKQTSTNDRFEVVVVDDNSTTNLTKKVVYEYRKLKNFRIRYVREKKIGLSYARNTGYKFSKGNYVAYIDDDAIAYPDWVHSIIQFILKNSSAVCFGGQYIPFTISRKPRWLPKDYGKIFFGRRIIKVDINSGIWIAGSNMIFKKEIFKEVGSFNTHLGMSGNKMGYGEETEMFIRILKLGFDIYCVPNIRVKHLISENKFSLWWNLKSYFVSGLHYPSMYTVKFERLSKICEVPLSTLLAMIKFVSMPAMPFKRRIYLSFGGVFFALGRVFS